MSRREARPARREEPRREGGRSGLFTGLMLGLAIGLAVAAGLAWYFNFHTGEFKNDPGEEAAARPAPSPAPPPKPVKNVPPEETATKPKVQEEAPSPPPPLERKAPDSATPAPRVPLTFYGILPGDKPAKPVEPPKSKEIWWLQVAALKNPGDADRLKARLTLLGLDVVTQKIEAAGQTLWRVRVGPYPRDEEAFADLDTLAAHNYEPRLLKEPAAP